MAKRIFVAGHRGMVGSALCRELQRQSVHQLVLVSRNKLDLTDQGATTEFFAKEAIDEVYLAAAKVGGIYANDTYPAEFIYQNLMIEANVIQAAHKAGIQKLLFLGSSCIYPKLAPQPIPESALLSGPLEPTNEPYAIAKIAGIKLCESYNRQYGRDYRSVMPTNLYGPFDNFHPLHSHVIPALMHKFRVAIENNDQKVEIWGSGKARREFMYVDDLARACVYLMSLSKTEFWHALGPECSHINAGTGKDITICQLAHLLKEITGFNGGLSFDESKPEGTPIKRLDVSKLTRLEFSAKTKLEEGLRQTWHWYTDNIKLDTVEETK